MAKRTYGSKKKRKARIVISQNMYLKHRNDKTRVDRSNGSIMRIAPARMTLHNNAATFKVRVKKKK